MSLFLGRPDYTGLVYRRAGLKRMKAPRKANIWFEHSAHRR